MKRNQTERRADRATDTRKRKWLAMNGLDRCVLSARPGADLAHLRDLTGMAMKPAPWRSLPLDRALHRVQETAGREFWESAGLPAFEFHAAELHAAFENDDAGFADALLSACHDFANLDYLADILRKAA
jgi:hypothetical protein